MRKKVKYILTVLFITLVLLLFLELTLGLIYKYREKQRNIAQTEFKISSGAYKNLDSKIVKKIYSELFTQDMQWEPYVHFRLKPQNETYTNINHLGIRKTTQLTRPEKNKKFKIFCFGGSTMFGTGSRDEHTIPSNLSTILYKAYPDFNFEITNFGCHGYNRSVENIQLQQQLLKNNIPDIVIFYDGVNEIISAYGNNEAGLPTNAINRKNEFKLGHSYSNKIKLLLKTSHINKLVSYLKRKTSQSLDLANKEKKKLAMDIAENYKGHLKLTSGLAHTYGFKTINFLQPVIFSKKKLSTPEKKMASNHFFYKDLYLNSYKIITKDSLITLHNFNDISNVFDKEKETIYTDFCHTAEYGNQLVAKRIFEIIKPYLMDLEN